MVDDGIVRKILELARWAPSGDNTQPWRFEIVDGRRVVVHGFDTRSHCVYDLDGHPSQLSLGALIETMAIAASTHGLDTRVRRRRDLPDTEPTFDIVFEPAALPAADALAGFIRKRSVQRRPLQTRPLTTGEKTALSTALPAGYRVVWLEGHKRRWAATRLILNNARLRLTLPEALPVHRSVIEWNARFSEDRIPDRALGIDTVTAKLMRWIMRSWPRVAFFNRYLGGTIAPRLQMDLLPGLGCAAHFVLVAEHPASSIDDYVAAGRAMQRFWLTATSLDLQLQPELTPLIFFRYAREGRVFSAAAGMAQQTCRMAVQYVALLGDEDARHAVFMGRIGAGAAATARSLRRPLTDLMTQRRS
jgi:nitroreductase